MEKLKMKRICFRVSEEDCQLIKLIANKETVTVSEYLRYVTRLDIRKRKRRTR